MKRRDDGLAAIGWLLFTASVASGLVGIWTQDGRWGGTAAVLFVAAFVVALTVTV